MKRESASLAEVGRRRRRRRRRRDGCVAQRRREKAARARRAVAQSGHVRPRVGIGAHQRVVVVLGALRRRRRGEHRRRQWLRRARPPAARVPQQVQRHVRHRRLPATWPGRLAHRPASTVRPVPDADLGAAHPRISRQGFDCSLHTHLPSTRDWPMQTTICPINGVVGILSTSLSRFFLAFSGNAIIIRRLAR